MSWKLKSETLCCSEKPSFLLFWKKIQIRYLLRYTKIILSLYSFNLYVEMNAWKQVPRRSFSMIFVLLETISSSFQPHVHPLIPIVPLIKQCKPNKQPKNGHKTKLLLIFRYQKQERSTCHLNVWWPTILDQRLEKKGNWSILVQFH